MAPPLRPGGGRPERFFRWLLTHRPAVLAAHAALLAVATLGAVRARVDYTIEQLFPSSGRARADFEEYRKAFPDEDVRFSLVTDRTDESGISLYRRLERTAREFEAVGLRDVHWLGSIPLPEATEVDGEPGVRVHPLIEVDRLSDAYARDVLARERENRLYRGYLWNAGQTAFAVHGTLPDDARGDERRREIEEELSARLNAARADGDRDGTMLAGREAPSTLGGIPVIRSRLPKLLESDQRMLLGGGLVLFILLLWFFFRSPAQVLFCLASALPAYLLTIGLMGWIGLPVTVLTSFIPIIVLVVGVSDSIHLLARFRAERREGHGGSEAIGRSFGALSSSCFYTSLTTAAGFLSLLGTRIGIVMEFGALTAFAVLTAFGFAMTLLPALLSLRPGVAFDDRGLRAAWLERLVGAAVRRARARPAPALTAFLLIGAVAVGAARQVRTNTLLLDDLRPRSELLRDLRWIEGRGFGLFQVVIWLRAEDHETLHDPAALAWMARFQTFAERDPLVFGTLGLPDFMVQLRGALDGQPDAHDRSQESTTEGAPPESPLAAALPESTAEASQLLLLAELEAADFLHLVYHPEDREAQIIVSVRDEGSVAILPFLDRIDRFLSSEPPPVGNAVPTGTVYLLQSYQSRILESFIPTIAIAVILITAILMWMFRSPVLGLLSLVPNLFPLLVLLGAMGMFSFDLKPSTILVFSIAFGIAVDDTIHLLARIREELRAGRDLDSALALGLVEVGPALVITTIVVSAGFSLLLASQFEVLFLVGVMTLLSALTALTADFFGLPAVLKLAGRGFVRRASAPPVAENCP